MPLTVENYFNIANVSGLIHDSYLISAQKTYYLSPYGTIEVGGWVNHTVAIPLTTPGLFGSSHDFVITFGGNSRTVPHNEVDADHGYKMFSGTGTSTYTYDVPEPASIALLSVGLIGISGVARRR